MPGRLRRPINAGLERVGKWLVSKASDAPREPPHPLLAFVRGGTVHPSVGYSRSTVQVAGGARISIGEDSIFHGRLTFHRPGTFRMGTRSYVAQGTDVRVTTSISIGDDVMISWGCTLLDTDMHSPDFRVRRNDVLIEGLRAGLTHADKDWSAVRCEPIVVQDRVWIGMNSIILRGVTLGEGCIVGAGSVVSKDVSPWTVVAGNPARLARTLSAEEPGVAAADPRATCMSAAAPTLAPQECSDADRDSRQHE